MQSEQVKERAASAVSQQETMFQPPKKKSKKKIVFLVLIVIAAAVFFLVRSLMGAGKELLSATYLTETAQVRDITVAVSSTGTVTPIDSYKVSALVTGEVLDAPFEEGDWVEKGQILYQIEAEDAQIAVVQAECKQSINKGEWGSAPLYF